MTGEIMKNAKLIACIMFALIMSSCQEQQSYQYDSIWQKVYGSTPPYAEDIESMSLKDN